jgi:hypothetical protein
MMGSFWHKKKEREYGTGSSRGVKSEMHANMLIVEIKFTILLSKHRQVGSHIQWWIQVIPMTCQ